MKTSPPYSEISLAFFCRPRCPALGSNIPSRDLRSAAPLASRQPHGKPLVADGFDLKFSLFIFVKIKFGNFADLVFQIEGHHHMIIAGF